MRQRRIWTIAITVLILSGISLSVAWTQPTTAPSSGLQATTITKGTGVKTGDTVWVHYSGKLTNGTEFDASLKHANHEPIHFVIGSGQVIKGWDQGIVGMQIGEKRQLTIPPELAYGAEGRPPAIPANATLVFEVELVGVLRGE